MTGLDWVRLGLQELGEGVSAEALSRYVHERSGGRVEPRFLPIYRATLRAEEERLKTRALAGRIAEEDRRGDNPSRTQMESGR